MAQARIASMDQFRGYTVAGMFLVNFLGGFAVVHPLLKHHNTYVSYADTIMPQFFLAVGFALRLVLLRRIEEDGRGAAYMRIARRSLALILIGVIAYGLDGNYKEWADLAALGVGGFFAESFWRSPFQALVHIAVTSLWVLPVAALGWRTRVVFVVASGLAHLGLSEWFWYDLLHERRVIDGGPLGFLTWALPTIAGTLAYDLATTRGARAAIRPLLGHGAWLMLLGYGMACLTQGGVWAAPPFVESWHEPDLWTMSQRAGSLSYLTFSSGFSLAVYALFVWWSDLRGGRSEVFATLGKNALAAYLIHMWVDQALSGFTPRDAPLWWAVATFALFFWLTLRMTRYLNERGLYLRM